MTEIEPQEVETDAEVEEAEVEETEESEAEGDTTKDTKVEKPTETLEQKQARLKRELKQTEKKLGIKDEKPTVKAKTDGLDDTVLDYLDLKGVSESEDVAVVEGIMKKTGMSAREALKDEYVVAKLASNKSAREVKDATPSSTKRSGGATDNVAQAIAKFEKDGILPDNFELRSKVVDAIEAKGGTNKPSWQ